MIRQVLISGLAIVVALYAAGLASVAMAAATHWLLRAGGSASNVRLWFDPQRSRLLVLQVVAATARSLAAFASAGLIVGLFGVTRSPLGAIVLVLALFAALAWQHRAMKPVGAPSSQAALRATRRQFAIDAAMALVGAALFVTV